MSLIICICSPFLIVLLFRNFRSTPNSVLFILEQVHNPAPASARDETRETAKRPGKENVEKKDQAKGM